MREKHTLQPRGLALLLLLLLLLCGLLATSVQAKYIFTEEPLARSPRDIGDQDLFGYATALHLVDDSGNSSDFEHAIQNTKIIVGAPNGTFPGGVKGFGKRDDDKGGPLNNTGLVYVCDINCTNNETCCQALTGNGTGNDIRLFDYQGNTDGRDPFNITLLVQDEEKSGQFMGATIVSTGKHIIACAPRWISLNIDDFFNGPFDKTRAHGRCFISDRNMTNFKLLRPCDQDNSQSLVGQSYCMAGTAASLQERANSAVSVYLGGPPFGESSGAVFNVNLTADQIAGDSPLDLKSPNFYPIPETNTMQQFWYTGMAVTLGRILGSTEEDLIYSLPKKNIYKGSVEVFSIDTGSIEATVLGEQMGEYFGWSVATADLNGDGFDEIIVGAPLFSTSDRVEKGRIFIYKNNGTLDTGNPIVIPGTGSKGRFGSAIANLGDINSDGFEDIAVSAPFESHKGGAEGTVYIYLGSGEDVINTAPEDTITAQQISEVLKFDETRLLKSFGYSLSSGVDVDANGNNDLVIGGYKQQTVIVLRTHSIANMSLSLATIPSELFEYRDTSSCVTTFGSFACFELEITASFSGRGLDGRPLDTEVAVRENAVSAGSRLFFLDSGGNRRDVFEGFLYFNTTGTQIKETIPVYVEGVGETDRRSPLAVVVTLSPVKRITSNESVDGLQDIFDLRDYPLLEVLPQNNLEQTLTIVGCENPDMCTPQFDLTLSKVRYLNSKRMPTEFTEIVAGGVSFIEVLLDYQTLTEDAVNSRIVLSLPSHLLGAPQSIRDTTNNIRLAQALPTSQCQRNMDDDTHICSVQPIFSSYDGTLQVEIIIAVSEEITGMDCVENCSAILTLVNADNNIANGSNNIVRLNLSVSALANVSITELSVNPVSTQYEDTIELKPVITTKVTIVNSGPSSIPQSQLVILIPGKSELTGDFYYLYPDRVTRVPASVTCSDLDPDGLNLNSQSQRRRRRSVMERVWRRVVGSEEEEEEEGGRGGLQKRQEITGAVNCSRQPEMCTAVICNISDFSPTSISILVLSYVDNRFFRTQSGNFELYMHATFNIMTSFVDGPPSTRTSNRLLVLEPQKGGSEEVPAWVIAVTVISAIITLVILAVIIILLYVLGFFKRRNKEEFAKKQELQRTQSTRVAAAGGRGGAAKTTTEEPALMDSKPEEDIIELDEKPPLPPPEEEVAPEKAETLEKASSETEL